MCCGRSLENWVQAFSTVCLSHIHKAAVGSLLTCVHNNNKLSAGFRQGGVQQTETGCNSLIPARRSCDFVYSTSTSVSAFDTFVFCVFIFASIMWLMLAVNQAGYLLLCSHITRLSADFTLGGQVEKVRRQFGGSWTFAFKHTPLQKKLPRISVHFCSSYSNLVRLCNSVYYQFVSSLLWKQRRYS